MDEGGAGCGWGGKGAWEIEGTDLSDLGPWSGRIDGGRGEGAWQVAKKAIKGHIWK